MTQTSWGRWDGATLLTNGGAFIWIFDIFDDDFHVLNHALDTLRDRIYENSVALGGVTNVTIIPNGPDAQISVTYESGPITRESARVVFASSVLSLYAANKIAIDNGEVIGTEPDQPINIFDEALKHFKL